MSSSELFARFLRDLALSFGITIGSVARSLEVLAKKVAHLEKRLQPGAEENADVR